MKYFEVIPVYDSESKIQKLKFILSNKKFSKPRAFFEINKKDVLSSIIDSLKELEDKWE